MLHNAFSLCHESGPIIPYSQCPSILLAPSPSILVLCQPHVIFTSASVWTTAVQSQKGRKTSYHPYSSMVSSSCFVASDAQLNNHGPA